jgi:tRNA A37 N6-isopentenylltransferase MiaA
MSSIIPDLILIKGAPATGKSQSAKELALYYPAGIRMEVDNLRSMVISVDWTNQEQHISILGISLKLVLEYLKSGFKPIIVVDTFSGDKINSYYGQLKLLAPELNITIFGLYASELKLKQRLDERSAEKFKDYEITKKINEDTLRYQHELEYQIDTSELNAKETAGIIYREIFTPDSRMTSDLGLE